MPIPPPDLADPPPRAHGYDALSEVLHAIRLRGEAVTRSQPDAAARHRVGARLVHLVQKGSVHLRVEGSPGPIVLHAGDLVLLIHGDTHTLRPDATARWVSGSFAFDNDAGAALFATLPRSVVVRGEDGEHRWLPLSLDLLLSEVDAPRAGSAVMISRILDLLLIHALRAWADSGAAHPGWLVAVMDPALGPVVSAIHRDPGQDWSVARLAEAAMLSRSAFAERFTRVVGESPAAYVARHRLERASRLLADTRVPLAAIAREVGYTSEAAFSRAFHRRYGEAPGRWRRESRQR